MTGYIDTCGTGGDGLHTFNISTTTAFVVAGAGVPVAKHGNRAVSSAAGSADVLEALGIDITLDATDVGALHRRGGVGFLFAQSLHSSMRHAGPTRREIGIRTVFNILGPLTNPAGAKRQLLGVYDARLAPVMAEVAGRLGAERVLVVHGHPGHGRGLRQRPDDRRRVRRRAPAACAPTRSRPSRSASRAARSPTSPEATRPRTPRSCAACSAASTAPAATSC